MRLVFILFAAALSAGAQSPPPADEWLPSGAVYSVEIRNVAALRQIIDVPKMFQPLLGDAATIAIYPDGTSVAVIDGANRPVLEPISRLASFHQDYPGGITVWSFDSKQFFALQANRLTITNKSQALKTLFTPGERHCLAGWAPYQAAKKMAGDGAGWMYASLDVAAQGPWKGMLRKSHVLSATLRVDGKHLRIHAVTDGNSEQRAVLPNLSVPGELAAASAWQDLAHSILLPHSSGGILAENFLEIFFTGRKLGEDVFGKIRPEVRLVVARQRWDAKIGTPEVQYPAAALVFRSDEGEDFGELMEEAWQKAVGLSNFTRGQQALPGLILDRQTHDGVTFTFGAFPIRGEKDRTHLPERFNLRPAIVHTGSYLILSTTDGLARDLIDAIHHESGRPPANSADTVVEVTDPSSIAELLTINKRPMIRQAVLEKGKKPAEAATEADQLIAWVRKLQRARLQVNGCEADLDLEVR